MKKILVILISIFCFSSIVNAKMIIIGSHGGQEVYLGGVNKFYCPTLMHWDYDQGELRNAESVAKIPDDNYDGYSLANGEDWNGHGIDASIVYYQNQRIGERVYSVIFDQASTITVAHKYFELVYNKGDKIFLVGYSAGGDFMMTLADWMNSNDYPIHLLGLIDPFGLSGDITIPANVEKVALYHQESNDPGFAGFLQGFNSYILQGSETSYFSGHPMLVEGVNHAEIDNSAKVWKDLGEKMLAEADDYEPEEGLVESEEPPEPRIVGYYYEKGTGVILIGESGNYDELVVVNPLHQIHRHSHHPL